MLLELWSVVFGISRANRWLIYSHASSQQIMMTFRKRKWTDGRDEALCYLFTTASEQTVIKEDDSIVRRHGPKSTRGCGGMLGELRNNAGVSFSSFTYNFLHLRLCIVFPSGADQWAKVRVDEFKDESWDGGYVGACRLLLGRWVMLETFGLARPTKISFQWIRYYTIG